MSGGVVRRSGRACRRGAALAAESVAGIPLFFVSLFCVLSVLAGIGVLLAPESVLAVRRLASRQRRQAREWSGVTIVTPYRPNGTCTTGRRPG